jgi:hypothetical protein
MSRTESFEEAAGSSAGWFGECVGDGAELSAKNYERRTYKWKTELPDIPVLWY